MNIKERMARAIHTELTPELTPELPASGEDCIVCLAAVEAVLDAMREPSNNAGVSGLVAIGKYENTGRTDMEGKLYVGYQAMIDAIKEEK